MTEAVRCAAHPGVETRLRCGKCDKPICPRCLVQTPVGARCRDCARLNRLPTYRVDMKYYLRAVGTGLGAAVVLGIAGWLIQGLVPFFSLNLLLAPLAGYLIGEVISRATNRKRGTGLAVISGTSLAAAYLITLWLGGFPAGIFGVLYNVLALALGVAAAVARLR